MLDFITVVGVALDDKFKLPKIIVDVISVVTHPNLKAALAS